MTRSAKRVPGTTRGGASADRFWQVSDHQGDRPGADLHGQAQAQFRGGKVTACVSDRSRRDSNRLERQRNVTTCSGHYDRGPDPPDLGRDRWPGPDRP